MPDLRRARLVGIIGTILPVVATFALVPVFAVTGGGTYTLWLLSLISIFGVLVVTYAVWLVSRLAGVPNIFWFFVISLILGIPTELFFFAGVLPMTLSSFSLGLTGQDLAAAVGLYALDVLSGVFVFLSYTRIAKAFANSWFRWAGILALAYEVLYVVVELSGILGLVSFALQVLAFYYLGRQGPGSSVPPPSTAGT